MTDDPLSIAEKLKELRAEHPYVETEQVLYFRCAACSNENLDASDDNCWRCGSRNIVLEAR